MRNQAENQHSAAELDTKELLSLHEDEFEGGSVSKPKCTHTPSRQSNTKHGQGFHTQKAPARTAASPAPDTAGDASAAGPGTAHPGELEGWQEKASPQLRVFSASLAHRVGTHQGSATRLGLFSSGSCLSTLCRTPDLQASQVRR